MTRRLAQLEGAFGAEPKCKCRVGAKATGKPTSSTQGAAQYRRGPALRGRQDRRGRGGAEATQSMGTLMAARADTSSRKRRRSGLGARFLRRLLLEPREEESPRSRFDLG